MFFNTPKHRSAFTLIEILISIAIIGIIAALVIIGIKPQEQLEKTNDVKRQQDLRVMVDATYQFRIDHGTWPAVDTLPPIDSEKRHICSLTGADVFFCQFAFPTRVAMGPLIPDYLAELPHDPENTEQYETGYRMWVDGNNRVYADAPLSDDPDNLVISR